MKIARRGNNVLACTLDLPAATALPGTLLTPLGNQGQSAPIGGRHHAPGPARSPAPGPAAATVCTPDSPDNTALACTFDPPGKHAGKR